MKTPTARQLIDRLVWIDRGRIVVCNLIDSLDEGIISATDLRSIIDWWRTSLPAIEAMPSPKKDKDALFGTFNLLRLEPKEWETYARKIPGLAGLGPKPEFRLCGLKKGSRRRPRSNLASAMRAETFFSSLAADAKTATLSKLGLDVSSEDSKVKWEDGGILHSASNNHIKPDSRLGMKGDLAWFTRTKEIQTYLNNGDADGLRDALGLAHVGHGVHLVALLFEPAALAGEDQGRPGALEAGGGKNARFMCQATGKRLRHGGTWGQSADLARFARGDSDIDGVPERVTKALEASQLGSISVHAVGSPAKDRGKSSVDSDGTFADVLARGRSTTQLRKAILSLIYSRCP